MQNSMFLISYRIQGIIFQPKYYIKKLICCEIWLFLHFKYNLLCHIWICNFQPSSTKRPRGFCDDYGNGTAFFTVLLDLVLMWWRVLRNPLLIFAPSASNIRPLRHIIPANSSTRWPSVEPFGWCSNACTE